jgi:hypothetical protein
MSPLSGKSCDATEWQEVDLPTLEVVARAAGTDWLPSSKFGGRMTAVAETGR